MRHLTYGKVLDVLHGVWQFMYLGERFYEVTFVVKDEEFGLIGVGRIWS